MKIGVVQLNLTDSISKNKKKILEYIHRATNEDVEILGFPETALTGYIFDDFFNVDYGEVDRAIQEISESIVQSKLHVILGTPYKDEKRIYNSAVILFPDGKRLIYHKNNLVDYEEKYFKKGDKKFVFTVNGCSFGVMICSDQNYPELARELKEMGALGIFISSAHYYELIESKMKREKNCALPVARAYENSCFVFKSNGVGSLKGKISFGNSMIVDPRGIVVLQAGEIQEQMLVYDINFDIENRQW
ncbi:carbon-nitrogen hydrolase family protein [bacterium]|nr:carbon-nitrogen hydrolase family protein [bacterium]